MKYKAAVIGLGKIGFGYDLDSTYGGPLSHTFAYDNSEKFNLVAGADVNYDIEFIFKSKFPESDFYIDYIKMLNEHEIDVVSICTPPELHLNQIEKILEVKTLKVIFCEKPLVKNILEYKNLKEVLKNKNCILIPNISRRFNVALCKVKDQIEIGTIGEIKKIHVKYTRGIHNTGAHLFDLLSWWVGKITKVQTILKVYTTSELENENSYSFNFFIENKILGYAEAFDDREYYYFEIDFYGSNGKISFQNSGDSISVYNVGEHSMFPEHYELKLINKDDGLLSESCFKMAMNNIAEVLSNVSSPLCNIEDAAYPLYVAEALEKSYISKKWESVDYGE